MTTRLDPERLALLYSGGTDSTLAAVKGAERYPEVHLLTFSRLGMFNVQNSDLNVEKLREIYGAERFVRPPVVSVDRLFRFVSYESYLRDLARHGFKVLTTCGLCKLAMHLRALVYCFDNGVGTIWDGANRHMTIFPFQMEEVLDILRDIYREAGISYENPVFDYDDDQGIDFGSALWGLSPARGKEPDKRTTGDELHELGILPERDVKGTPHDKKMQGRCYQFVLFNLWARWYELERKDLETYRAEVLEFYKEKMGRCRELVLEHLESPATSRLRGLCQDAP